MHNNTPKVSVIIPVYNSEKYLRKSLDSVIAQSLKDIEIVCINDGSTDNSLEILKEYAKKDKRVIIIHSKLNQGVAYARNLGLVKAQGEFVSFVDSDDWIDSRWLELLLEAGGYSDWQHGEVINDAGGISFRSLQGSIIRRKLLEDYGIFFPLIKSSEDSAFARLLKGSQVRTRRVKLDKTYYHHERRANSLCNYTKEDLKNPKAKCHTSKRSMVK